MADSKRDLEDEGEGSNLTSIIFEGPNGDETADSGNGGRPRLSTCSTFTDHPQD